MAFEGTDTTDQSDAKSKGDEGVKGDEGEPVHLN